MSLPNRIRAVLVLALVGVCAAPAAALGATTVTTDVTGTVGSELALAIATAPSAMTFTNSTDGSASVVLDITGTVGWTLTARDASATTPGYLDQVNCSTRAALGGSLGLPLAWSNAAQSLSGSLSGTGQTVATGTSTAQRTIAFSQPVGDSETLNVNDCYQLTVTYTVS